MIVRASRLPGALALRCLGRGLPVRIVSDLPTETLRTNLARATQTRNMDSWVESMYPSPENRRELTGKIGTSGVRLYLPIRDRRPWWRLSPVFHGNVEETDSGSSCLSGVLRVRLHLLIGILALVLALIFVPSNGPYPIWSWKLVPSIWLAKFVWDVFFALPKTSAALVVRLEAVTGGSASFP